MDYGVILPQVEIGFDRDELREYAQTAEDLGFRDLQTFDRVLGVSPDYSDFDGPYDNSDYFHEPLVLLGYLAAMTEQLNLLTGILVLPQRQTAVVAKQATEIDVLSEGRLRLGVGVGWNAIEFEGLGFDFEKRGERMTEQIELLRELWTNEAVNFDGRWHTITQCGLNPLPHQRPIPIWMGGGHPRVLKRLAKIADGWLTPRAPFSDVKEKLHRLRTYANEAGRDPDEISVIGRMNLGSIGPTSVDNPETWAQRCEEWEEIGADAMMIETTNMELETAEDHIALIGEFKDQITEAGLSFEKTG